MQSIRRYRASDHAAVIALFRGFMQEFTPPHLAAQFEAYIETAIREELAFCREAGYRKVVLSTSELQVAAMRLYEASGYRLERKESAARASHKSVGAGLARYHYEKALA